MSLKMKLVIWEIGDREKYGVTAAFTDDLYGDDQLVMSFQPDLKSALNYVKHMCQQGYPLRYELDIDSSNTTKVNEDLEEFRDFEASIELSNLEKKNLSLSRVLKTNR